MFRVSLFKSAAFFLTLAIAMPVIASQTDAKKIMPSIFSLLLDDEIAPEYQALNDTGVIAGVDYPSGNNTGCTGTVIFQQDCFHGRDVTHDDDLDGHAGFSFTKLSSTGTELSVTASSWSCVRDNVTGLIWEVKTDDGGIHDKDNLYRWGGNSVQGSGYGTYYADWNALLDASNNANLCGGNNWRVPVRQELENIVDFSTTAPSIDTAYFLNTPASLFWTASPSSSSSSSAWSVDFGNGISGSTSRNTSLPLRLVRSQ